MHNLVWLMLFTFQLKLKCYHCGYSVLSAHQGVEDEITEEVELISLTLQLATSYLTKAFLLPKVTVYYTTRSEKSQTVNHNTVCCHPVYCKIM